MNTDGFLIITTNNGSILISVIILAPAEGHGCSNTVRIENSLF